MAKKKSGPLWTIVGGEPYLIDGAMPRRPRGAREPWFSFGFYRDPQGREQPVLLNPPCWTWEEIPSGAFVNAHLIARRYGCNRRTIANHVAADRLRVAKTVRKTFFFLKQEVERWSKSVSLKPGRPWKNNQQRKGR